MKKDQFISFCFIALLVFVIYEIFLIFSPFFKAIFWAAILAFGCYPLYEKLKKRLGGGQTVASLLMTIAILLVVLPLLALLIANIAVQAVEFYQLASTYVREGHIENFLERVRSLAFVQRLQTDVLQWEPLKQNMVEWFLNSSRAITNFSVAQAGTITKNLFVVSLNAILIAFFIFIFLRDGEKIYNFIYQISPFEENNKRYLFTEVTGAFEAVIRGQLLTSLTQALVAGTVFWLLGLPLPIYFGIATFITALIPVIGASGVWLPLVIYLVVLQSYAKAVILLVIGVLVISLIDNVMKPALIGERTKLPYFLLFFGIFGGIKLYGLMGIFLAPVMLSLFFALVKIYQEKFL